MMSIRMALAVLLLLVVPTARALDYSILSLPNLEKRAEVVAGDLNGDGRDDIVASELTRHEGQVANNGRIHVYLQRASGNFDFPLVYECGCDPLQLRLIGNPADDRKRVLFRSILDGSTQPNLPRGGFTVLDVRADGTLAAERFVEGYLLYEDFNLVDVNQDGREDLFLTYLLDDNTTPQPESTYRIWYGAGVSEATAGRVASLNRFRDYQGPAFVYSGMTETWRYTDTIADRVDIDADGLPDAIEGLCPTECLFQQQPHGKLEATPLSYGGELSGHRGFGDLDGDGLPDQIVSSYGLTDDVKLFLQASPKSFSLAGTIGPYFATEPPEIADLDNNGLNDLLFTASDDSRDIRKINAWLQMAPGEFTRDLTYVPGGGGRWHVRDLNRDGCRDLLKMGPDGVYILRGRGCGPAADLEVRASTSEQSVQVEVLHRSGPRPFQVPRVRVTVAPASPGSQALAFGLIAPPGCAAVAAEAPRRMFDCTLATVQPAQRVRLPFTVQVAAGNATPISVTAFLLDSGGDLDPENNRVQVRSTFTTLPPRRKSTP